MKKHLILATIVAMAFVGCKKQTTAPTKEPVDKRVAARFVSKNIPKAELMTRVTKDGKWQSGDIIGITVFNENANVGTANPIARNVKYIHDGVGEFQVADRAATIYLPNDEKENVDMVASYPYTILSDMTKIEVKFQDQKNPSIFDIFWAKVSGINRKKPEVALNFQRLMSNVVITLKAGPGIVGEDLKNAKINIQNIPLVAHYNYFTGIVTPSSSGTGNLSATTGATGSPTVSFILPPQTTKDFSRRSISVEVADKGITTINRLGTFTAAIPVDFVSGKLHEIEMTLSIGTPPKFKATIKDWETQKTQITVDKR